MCMFIFISNILPFFIREAAKKSKVPTFLQNFQKWANKPLVTNNSFSKKKEKGQLKL